MVPGIIYTKQQMIAEIKHAGSFSHGYMVGDSVSDIVAGKEEMLETIAVNFGYEREDVLATVNPTMITESFQNLYRFVLRNSQY